MATLLHPYRLSPRIFALVGALLFALLHSAAPVLAATIEVSGDCTLAEAIANANSDNNGGGTGNGCTAGDGEDVIKLTGDVNLGNSNALKITSTLTIDGANPEGGRYTLSGTKGLLEAYAVANADSTVTPITLTIKNLKLTNSNSETSASGAIYAHSSASLIVNDSEFANNSTSQNGAAIYSTTASGKITISNSTFSDNKAGKNGGAIYANGSSTTVTISKSTFKDNESVENGGALNLSNGTVSISGSTFSDNSSTGGSSGAVSVTLASVTISDSLFGDNTANQSGGAIGNVATTNIYRSVFSGNSAGVQGGAIATLRGMRLENSTLYDNVATGEGGAVFSYEFSPHTVTIRHVSFVNNKATGSGKNGNAVYFEGGVTANMYNSIIEETKNADDSSYDGTDCEGLDLNSDNIIEDGSCSTSSTLSVVPMLGSRDGGAMAYYTLKAASPAIDGATSAAAVAACDALVSKIDQRGAARPYGEACDIGSWEYYPPTPSPSTPTTTTLLPVSLAPLPTGPGGAGVAERSGPAVYTGEELLLTGIRVWAQHGLRSGIQFQRRGVGAVGNPSVIDEGVLDVVDVWGYAEQDWEVCFPQGGSPVFLDAAGTPRVPESAAGYSEEGYTCIANDRAGMVVLQPGTSPAAAAAAAVGAEGPEGSRQLDNCMVRTNYIVNFRETPGGELLHYEDPWGGEMPGWLPWDVTLTALERRGEWYRVDYYGTRGWVHADYVTGLGDCA